MTVPAIGALTAGYGTGSAGLTGLLGATGSTSATGATGATGSTAAAAAGAGSSGDLFAQALDGLTHLQQMQSTAGDLAVQAVTGDLDDIHDYTIAATEAKVALELTAALRNKAVDAFTEIMRMQA